MFRFHTVLTVTVNASEVEVPLDRLVKVHGAGLWGAQKVVASQGFAGERLGALGSVTWSLLLLQEAGVGGERRSIAGRVEVGAALSGCYLLPEGGVEPQKIRKLTGNSHLLVREDISQEEKQKSFAFFFNISHTTNTFQMVLLSSKKLEIFLVF